MVEWMDSGWNPSCFRDASVISFPVIMRDTQNHLQALCFDGSNWGEFKPSWATVKVLAIKQAMYGLKQKVSDL